MIDTWMFALMLASVTLLAGLLLMFSGRRQRDQQRSRLQVNRELYLQRKAELAEEVRDGYLTEHAAKRSLAELDKRFVQENAELEQLHDQVVGAGVWRLALLVMVLGAIGYGFFGSFGLQQQALQAQQQLPQLGPKILPQIMGITAPEAQLELSPEEVDQVALGLRLKLMREPGDAVAWMVYAELMTRFGLNDEALAAFEKSYQLDNSRLTTLGSYARLLVTIGDETSIARAARLLARMLELEPGNLEGLSLLGVVALQRGDYAQAEFAWQLLRDQLALDDPRRTAVEQALAQLAAQQRLASEGLAVTVELSPELQGQVPADATLFVYVRAPQGNPMPAAVVRQAVGDWPVTVRLTAADAMLADYNLSSLDQWQVMARISSDTQIEAAPGDLDATPVVVAAGTAAVVLNINQIKQ